MFKGDDGGPAFPRPASEFTKNGTLHDGNDAIDQQDGMSLRDYLAAQARPSDVYGEDGTIGLPTDTAQALMGSKNPEYGKDPLGNARWFSDAIARWKYMHADSMLAARKSTGKSVGTDQCEAEGCDLPTVPGTHRCPHHKETDHV